MAELHRITVKPVASGGAESMYLAECSCGRYRSRKFNFPGYAEQAGQHHADAKNAGVTHGQ